MSLFELTRVHSPLVISVPHDGALIPDDIRATMHAEQFESSDRDLLISEVFAFSDLACSVIKANYSRHVIDLNRPATGEALYQGQSETELCPTTTFDWQPLYQPGFEPDAAEIRRRIDAYWRPYHQQLKVLIDTAVDVFGHCLLIDAHSIDPRVPRFFEGLLPDINVGTNDGQSCLPIVEQHLMECLSAQQDFSLVNNGRFKGGHITRHYGRPGKGVSAIQLEHSKSAYLNEQQNLSPKGRKLRRFWEQAIGQLIKTL